MGNTLEARRLRGSVDQIAAEPRGGHAGMVTRGGNEDTRTRGHEGRRELAPDIRRLKAERLTPERPTTVAVTRHRECIVAADAMSSHPSVDRLISGPVGKGAKNGEAYTLFVKG